MTSIARVIWLGTKIIQGDSVQTRDLSDCSRMLYHWAICPLPAAYRFNITANTCRLFEHCYNVFCSPSQVSSRDRCHFSLVFQKLYKGTPGFEPGTSRTADACSPTELYHRCMHKITSLQTRAGVWAVLQYFCRVGCSSVDRCHFSAVREVPGSNPGVPLYNLWKTREKWHRSREYTWLGTKRL